jgi:hypothetical protein
MRRASEPRVVMRLLIKIAPLLLKEGRAGLFGQQWTDKSSNCLKIQIPSPTSRVLGPLNLYFNPLAEGI